MRHSLFQSLIHFTTYFISKKNLLIIFSLTVFSLSEKINAQSQIILPGSSNLSISQNGNPQKNIFLNAKRFRFYSPSSKEAQLSFNFFVEFNKNSQPTETEVKTTVEKQLTFLFSGFSNQYRKAVPKADHQFQVLKVTRQPSGVWRAEYSYLGLILISDGPVEYSFYLPHDPYSVWKKGQVINSSNPYPCTDPHYAVEKYLWYFFTPQSYGCPLTDGKDYSLVKGKIKPLANSRNTYPEYDRLFVNAELTFHILFGMDNSSLDWNPKSSTDLSARSYRDLKSALITWGYKSYIWSPSEINQFFGANYYGQQPAVEEFTKQTPKGLIRYRLFFGSSTYPDGIGFYKFLVNSLQNSSIMIYAGHSGLGEYLNIDLIQNYSKLKVLANKERYQIYFFNSCSSYPYYNSQYFNLKKTSNDPKGTLNLDIITNGLSTLFTALTPSNLSLMKAVEVYATQNKKVSYQDIINEANSDNLIGIIGDEDNKR